MADWNELVQRGRSAKERLAQAKFDLGDLAGEVETSYGGGQLQAYAEAIEIEYGTLRKYGWVAKAFSENVLGRTKAPWSVYEMLAGREDRYEILAEQERWTVAQMRARLNKRQNYYSQSDPDETARRARDLAPEQRAEIVREALTDPAVAEKIEPEITTYVAADDARTQAVMRTRDDAPAPKPARRAETDYDETVGRAVDWISVALGAESSGKWTPSERTEALLYFLTQVLGDRKAPTGENASLVNDKLEELFRDAEQYANTEAR